MKIIETDWTTHKKELMAIRSKVFIEEQKVPAELEIDTFDPEAMHFIVQNENINDNDSFVATARLLNDGHIGRIAVLKEYRKQGIGSKLLKYILQKSRQLSLAEVYLHAQVDAKAFYEKHKFYAQGDIFMDAGIPHITMIKPLDHAIKL